MNKPENMSVLARVLENMIAKGIIAGIDNKIDIFYAASRISDVEYAYLMEILQPANAEEEVYDIT